jgi:hypothetical protein|nr:MAG TPA_asm: hypothetical protein [Bacteriophage sp.]
MTTETFALLSFISCLALGAGCVTLFILWVAEGREVEDLRRSKDELRESLTKHNYSLFQEKENLKKEVAAKTEEIDELKRCTRKLAKTNRLCVNMYKAMRAELRAKAPYPTEDISRKLIDRSLRPFVWCKAGDDEWWTMVNAWRLHICKYSDGGGWCVYSVSERLKSNLDMVLPTLKEAKAEGRAWIVEQIYSMFNRDNQD